MLKMFDPTQSRQSQLDNAQNQIKMANPGKQRNALLLHFRLNFALILKRNHNNFLFGSTALRKPSQHIEELAMAPKSWQKEFAALPLSEKDKAPLQLFAEEHENNVLEALENLLGMGYKISVLWSDASSAFIVSVIGTEETKHNGDKVLSSFSSDLTECIFMAGYKVGVLAKNGEWPTAADSGKWG